MNVPTLDDVKARHGRSVAMLDAIERAVLAFYQARGRKFDVAVSIASTAQPADLARAQSRQEIEAIMLKANSVVHVVVGPNAEEAWASRSEPTAQ